MIKMFDKLLSVNSFYLELEYKWSELKSIKIFLLNNINF